MPIVISRQTGEILSKPEYTQEQYDRAWEQLVKAFAAKHPEVLEACKRTEGKP